MTLRGVLFRLRRLFASVVKVAGWPKRWWDRQVLDRGDRILRRTLWPANWAMAAYCRFRPGRGVVHISYMVHVPFYTVEMLRESGTPATYLAIGQSPYWSKSDAVFEPPASRAGRAWAEWKCLWGLLARHRIVHSHFMYGISADDWAWRWLKRAGVRLLVHFRGCEARDRARNMALHPEVNICQGCEYDPYICEMPMNIERRAMARAHADRVLVTTRDMHDFVPDAEWFPFFAPVDQILPEPSRKKWPDSDHLRLVHATAHPGLEGRPRIEAAVDAVRADGLPVEFHPVTGVSHAEVLQALADADVAIGKMTMGDYANAQIESMCLGVPTITWVRPEYRTPELEASGFLLAHLDELPDVLRRLVRDPGLLAQKRELARKSILQLHDNSALIARLNQIYAELAGGRWP